MFQESMCLFEYKLTKRLPDYCHCEDEKAWASAQLTYIHEESYSQEVDDYGDALITGL